MMSVGWWSQEARTPTGHYGMGGRSFFVPARRCQALTLACQALDLRKTLKALGCRLKAMTSSLEPGAWSRLLWWWK